MLTDAQENIRAENTMGFLPAQSCSSLLKMKIGHESTHRPQLEPHLQSQNRLKQRTAGCSQQAFSTQCSRENRRNCESLIIKSLALP